MNAHEAKADHLGTRILAMHIGPLSLVVGALVLGNGLTLSPVEALAAGRPVVVELFTSEGCSSCPPADAILTDLAGSSRDVLPLAFHVTYWNRLGWRDPYSLQAATDRQSRYAGQLGGGSFTPQLVVDGRKSVVGSDRGDVLASIAQARGHDAAAPIDLSRGAAGIDVAIGSGRGHGRVLLIGFDPQHVTPVGRGENRGLTLTESNIVRSIQVLGTWSGSPLRLTGTIAGADAAVLIQGDDGHILGAARIEGARS